MTGYRKSGGTLAHNNWLHSIFVINVEIFFTKNIAIVLYHLTYGKV